MNHSVTVESIPYPMWMLPVIIGASFIVALSVFYKFVGKPLLRGVKGLTAWLEVRNDDHGAVSEVREQLTRVETEVSEIRAQVFPNNGGSVLDMSAKAVEGIVRIEKKLGRFDKRLRIIEKQQSNLAPAQPADKR